MRYSTYERPLTFFDMMGAVFRYKWRVGLVFLLTLFVGTVVIFLLPKKFESEAKLFVRLGRGSASLDPATIGQTISIQESRESEMNSIVDMLESRGLAERIVDQIGYERVLKKYAWAEVLIEDTSDQLMELAIDNIPALESSPSDESELTSDDVKKKKEYERAVKELVSNLNIDSPKKSNTISVEYRARTPELAHDVVQAVVDNYMQMHIEAYKSGGALDFFNREFAQQQERVSKAEDELREKKNKHFVVTMTGKQESLQTEITEVKKMELQAKADLESAKAKVRKLQIDLDRLPKEMLSERTMGIAQHGTDLMRERLYELELQEKELSAKYVSSHPELVKVREQVRDAKRILGDQPKDRAQSVVAVNPVRMDLQNQMLLAQADVASFQARVDELTNLEKSLVSRLEEVNNLEIDSLRLSREIEIARNNHKNYAQKLEESRIKTALDQEAVSNVSVVGQPTIRYKHESPKRSILLVLAVMFSGILGIAVAIASDYIANAKEMRAIREAERVRYLRELEEEKEIRTIETKSSESDKGGVLVTSDGVSVELDDDDSPRKAR